MVLKNIVSEDVDPFEAVQLETSFFPTLLYNVTELKTSSSGKADQILNTVKMELQQWQGTSRILHE